MIPNHCTSRQFCVHLRNSKAMLPGEWEPDFVNGEQVRSVSSW